METDKWYVQDDVVYLMQETGRYKKGEPILENKYTIHIGGNASREEKINMAKAIYTLLESLPNKK